MRRSLLQILDKYTSIVVSQAVDIERIKRFKKDRKLLPYDDIGIAKRMNVDRSNYSKAVNSGPITNTFLTKFYTAFEDELAEIVSLGKPVGAKEIKKKLEDLERKLEESSHLMIKMEQLIESIVSMINEKLTRIEDFIKEVRQVEK